MEQALILSAVFIIPVGLLVAGFKVTGRRIAWAPLLTAGFAFLIYIALLKSRSVFPVPPLLTELPLIWFGKMLSLTGTVVMLLLISRVSFRSAGVVLRQNEGSVRPALIAGAITIVSATTTAGLLAYSPDASVGNLLFQATLPGLDEELFMRGLLLVLFHQAFGKGLKIFGADTGWGFWLVVLIFGLLHGVSTEAGALQMSVGAIVSTGFVGFVLTWMRERTGSLVIPIVFHNAFNVAMAFV